jgi:hypothetical protein
MMEAAAWGDSMARRTLLSIAIMQQLVYPAKALQGCDDMRT